MKWELEDLSFKTLHPGPYREIASLVEARRGERKTLIDVVTASLRGKLKELGIKAEVEGRPKHLYSIYEKMVIRGKEFNEIYDLVGVRIQVDNLRDTYGALGAVHALWRPIPGRFKDYIAMPKFNLYQSLHTTVVGPQGKPLEIQIRTKAMHRTAEYGVVAQAREAARSRRANGQGDATGNSDDLVWLHRLLDWQRAVSDPGEFLESLRSDLSDHEVLVFTPKGDALTLPAGATPVDMAYALRAELGHHCIGARVNGQLVPLASVLADGDVVEILTSSAEYPGPSKEWLGSVKSPQAHVKIRQWLASQHRDDAVDAGQQAIDQCLSDQGWSLQRAMEDGSLAMLDYADLEAMYRAVGQNQLSAQSVAQWLVTVLGTQPDA
jgi:GTP pyrophosphokinase